MATQCAKKRQRQDGDLFAFYSTDYVVDMFYPIMQNIQEKKQSALEENQNLVELRNWLLPMLMNGQVTIKDNEV